MGNPVIYVLLLCAFLLSLVSGLAMIAWLVRMSHRLHLYDLPDLRKVHTLPIPRLGGVAFLPSALVAIVVVTLVANRAQVGAVSANGTVLVHLLSYVGGCALLYLTGLYDDLRGVSYRVKFLVQIISACVLCMGGLWLADMQHILWLDRIPWWVGMPLTVLFVVYVTNAVNLIDGIDGLASGLSSIALMVMASLFMLRGEVVMAMLSVAMLGVVAAFFYFNVCNLRHRTFMGDTGSLTLGFTLSFLALHFLQSPVGTDGQPATAIMSPAPYNTFGIVALSTLIIPLFDVVRVFMSRVRDHRNPFMPDKNHIHHKLLRTGLGPHMTMGVLLLSSLCFIGLNGWLSHAIAPTLLLLVDVVLYVAVQYAINYFIGRQEERTGHRSSRIY